MATVRVPLGLPRPGSTCASLMSSLTSGPMRIRVDVGFWAAAPLHVIANRVSAAVNAAAMCRVMATSSPCDKGLIESNKEKERHALEELGYYPQAVPLVNQ